MKKTLLTKYSEGSLSQNESDQLEALIASGEVSLTELDNFNNLEEAFLKAEELDFPSGLDNRMAKVFENPKGNKENGIWKNLLIIGGILFAFGLGMYLTRGGSEAEVIYDEVTPTSFAATLMETEDITDRIHLVSNTQISDDTDQKVIDALLFALNNDQSTNVRLACIEALFDYSMRPDVRMGFVKAISNQTSPIVLSNLAEAINASGEGMTKEEIKSRLNQELPTSVQQSIEKGFIQI